MSIESVELGTTAILTYEFIDKDGNKYDPTSVEVDIWDSGGTQRMDGGSPTQEATGEYSIEFTITDTWPTGAYLARWEFVVSGATYKEDHVFWVKDTKYFDSTQTEVTIEMVRAVLNDISAEMVSDAAIGMYIRTETSFVLQHAGETVTDQIKDEAILWRTAYMTIMGYAVSYERASGRSLPIALQMQLSEIKQRAEAAMQLVSREDYVLPPVIAITKSHKDLGSTTRDYTYTEDT